MMEAQSQKSIQIKPPVVHTTAQKKRIVMHRPFVQPVILKD